MKGHRKLSQSQNKEVPNKNMKDPNPSQVDVTAFADFSKIGYDNYEHYPGAYAFSKIIEESKSDSLFEKKDHEFNFYEHI